MKLTNTKLIANSQSTTQSQVFGQIADLLIKEGLVKNKKAVVDGFKAREAKGSTGMAEGFAIPHTTNAEIKEPKVVVIKKAKISKWETLDGKAVDTVIAIVVPENGRGDHLAVLTALSGKLANADFAKKIKTSKQPEVEKMINSIDAKLEDKKETTAKSKKGGFDIVGVTACSTGIAHTYMAAEALEEAAKEMGVSIKIETQGQVVKNTLTDSDINNAKGIILGIERDIAMDRFAGKDIIKVGAKEAIKNAKKLIEEALKGKTNTTVPSSVKSTGGEQRTSGEGQLTLENFGKRSWKAVMAGVSYMLPFVIFGGIFTALAFLIDAAAGNGDAGSNFGSVNDVAAFLKSIGGVSMGLMVPILTAFIMNAMIGRQGLLPGFIIGMLAAGNGPVFTYVFGISNPGWLDPSFTESAASSGFIGGIAGAFWGVVAVVAVFKLLDKLPEQLRGITQILLLPLVGTTVAVIPFWFFNIPLVYVMWGLLQGLKELSDLNLLWLVTLLLGGMMAVDMGGPINKTAYVFGTVMLAQPEAGGQILMAAVMAGGMVPPLAIAIATLFKRKTIWDAQDREGGLTNWIMGFSFITEGAIPFASKYPKAIILPNIIGSAIAGLLVGILGLSVAAPHGGIFVFPLVTAGTGVITLPWNWLAIILYLVVILIGSLVSALIIVALRSNEVKKAAQA